MSIAMTRFQLVPNHPRRKTLSSYLDVNLTRKNPAW
jgi:hypothetical protein